MKKVFGKIVLSKKEFDRIKEIERSAERSKCLREWSKPLTDEQKAAMEKAGIFEVTDAFWYAVNEPYAVGGGYKFAYKVKNPRANSQKYMPYHELYLRGMTPDEIKDAAIRAERQLSRRE